MPQKSPILFTLVLCLLGGCGGFDEPTVGDNAAKGDLAEADLALARQLLPGDIFVTSDSEGDDCWYLSKLENWKIEPRYCHAGMFLSWDEINGVTTLEALNEDDDVQIVRQEGPSIFNSNKVALLRVVHLDGSELTAEDRASVVQTAMQWLDAPYIEPPIPLDGDPHKTGIYCSMLPYRAYLDALGIDLDAFSVYRTMIVPLIVTPDELYESPDARLLFERPKNENSTRAPLPST